MGLGSNVGDKEEYIEQAIFLLNKTKGIEAIKHSSNYETEPEGGDEDQPNFMNAAVLIKTILPPDKLLKTINDIENALGRERETEWGPRTIDIDILFYDDLIMSTDDLQIPHPLAHDRLFVLKPMIEINPNFVHPVLEKTMQDLLDEKKSEEGETYDDELPGFKEIKSGTYDDYERW
ncbi:MAG: 2-amino-4-hydroxy-6-hydroxymethyldihydropteridine diphosphokinase [Candidatus Margulisbacteria bacterium]|nr:2-amino-4-hydroxy-6-hydroxymethyldihydropteridine diphosphokinase [Candidatus Margulisiibacteriota bacterium]